jgi:hypothetical protein
MEHEELPDPNLQCRPLQVCPNQPPRQTSNRRDYEVSAMLARVVGVLAFCAVLLSLPALAQKRRFGDPVPYQLPPACGKVTEKFVIKYSAPRSSAQPQAGKALVYFIQSYAENPTILHAQQIRLGLDGVWAGAALSESYFSFSVDPGVHHLCAVTDQSSQNGGPAVALAHFTAEAGAVYYFEAKVGVEATPLNVDSDEGDFLVATHQSITSYPKK